ncbi:Hypothetical protein PBC10988_26850 [Planctomycetales bacterium 10988]|nr:Hypothetical protein PBC10988_26850 [Planctomycetales bacterium 10988]
MRFGIGAKVGIFTLWLLAIVLIASLLLYVESRKVLVEHEMVDLKDETLLKGREFVEQILRLREDALLLADINEMDDLLARASEVDADDPRLRALRREIVNELKLLLQDRNDPVSQNKEEAFVYPSKEDSQIAKAEYLSVRLIDHRAGREILRVRWDSQSKLLEDVPADELAKNDDTAPFPGWDELIDHQIYVSAVEGEPTVQWEKEQQGREVHLVHIGVPIFGASSSTETPLAEENGQEETTEPADPEEEPWGLLMITADLGPALQWIARAPRHFVYVSNEAGRLLFTADASQRFMNESAQDTPAPEYIWQVPELADLGLKKYFEPDTEDARRKRPPSHGITYKSENELFSLRSDETKIATNPEEYLFKVPLTNWSELDTTQGKIKNIQTRRALRERLREMMEEYPQIRTSREIRPDMSHAYMRGPDLELLASLQKELAENPSFRELFAGDWRRIDCKTLAVHFVQLPYEPDGDHFFGLAIGASYEELESDIQSTLYPVIQYAGMVLGLATFVVLLYALRLTNRLREITEATQGFAEGKETRKLPVRARDEIGRLARSFEHMVGQVRLRSQALAENEMRLRSILDTAAEGIITISSDGNLESANPAAERIFGVPRGELTKYKISQLMILSQAIPAEEETELANLAEVESGGSSEIRGAMTGTQRLQLGLMDLVGRTHELVGKRPSGEEFPMELSVSIVQIGSRQLLTAIVRDVTQRKLQEERINQLNADLERRVKERTAELRKANGELVLARDAALEASRAKDIFLTNMSHELRTPLSSIIGFSEMLQEEAEELDQEDFVPDLKNIHSAGKHLLALINDILDWAKIEAGRMSLQPTEFEIAPMVQLLVEMVNPLVKKNNNRLEIDCPADIGSMISDQTRVNQVLLNLLSNASKFTEDGVIRLGISREVRPVEVLEDSHGSTSTMMRKEIIFTVSDTGNGMSLEQQKQLFQRFSLMSNRKHGGAGLGLAISRRLSQMMGGDISVSSELGKGSSFTVRIPVKPNAAEDKRNKPKEASQIATRKPAAPVKQLSDLGLKPEEATVLVIDDDPAVRELMQRFLSKTGFHILVASSGEEGLRLAKHHHPQVITLDAVMPGIDGWGVLAALKADEETSDIPIIMVTMVDDKTRGFALGAVDFVGKPIDWKRLEDLLKRHAETRSLSPEESTVLVVEDDANSREVITRRLSKAGWQVVQAANGRQGLAALEQVKPSLVLLDLIMPELDGFEFVERLRTQPELAAVPIVVVTSMDLTKEERERLNGSVEQILQKGAYHRDDLLQEIDRRVREYLGQTESTDAPPTDA